LKKIMRDLWRALKGNLYIVIFIIPIAVAISILLIVCRNNSSIDTSLFTVELIDDVRYVHNHAPQFGDTPSVKLELIGKMVK